MVLVEPVIQTTNILMTSMVQKTGAAVGEPFARSFSKLTKQEHKLYFCVNATIEINDIIYSVK